MLDSCKMVGPKAVWSILYVSVAFFPILKQNLLYIVLLKCPDCIFELHQLWQSGFSRMFSNCCCSCSFEAEIIKIGQSSHKMYSNNKVNIQVSMTILKSVKKSLETYWMHHVHFNEPTYTAQNILLNYVKIVSSRKKKNNSKQNKMSKNYESAASISWLFIHYISGIMNWMGEFEENT